jgi:hypothetical protein
VVLRGFFTIRGDHFGDTHKEKFLYENGETLIQRDFPREKKQVKRIGGSNLCIL